VPVGAYLEARGRQAELLFGFLGDRRLALVSTPLFLQGTTLEGDAQGVVRCRLSGRPAAFVRLSNAGAIASFNGLTLDLLAFARAWPRLHAELIALAGPEVAAALVAAGPILRPLEDLKPLILEHSILAEDLFVLGAQVGPLPELEGARQFSFRFDQALIELSYAPEVYRRFLAEAIDQDRALTEAIEARYNGASVALLGPGDLPWHDDEVAELAVLGSMFVKTQPEELIKLYAAVCRERFDQLEPSLALGSVLNLWGVALRKMGALDLAVVQLEKAYGMASSIDPQLEQQVAYNLGYAKLQTTMTARAQIGVVERNELVQAHYDVSEAHRATWRECLALFERAVYLDPRDATAAAQVQQVYRLLAVLDGSGPEPSSAPPGPVSKPRAQERPEPTVTRRSDLRWLIGGVAVLVVFIFLLQRRNEQRAPVAPRTPPTAPTREPSARERSESARLAALASLSSTASLDSGAPPCELEIEPPQAVPRGEVVAPHLARAPGTGELYGAEYFDETVRQYRDRFAPPLDVRPAHREGVGPITEVEGPRDIWSLLRSYAATLIVTSWRDPVILEGGASLKPGRITGRLVVWSYETSRLVCASDFEATNMPGMTLVQVPDLVRPSDDPLNRARLDLVEQAYRQGIPALRQYGGREIP